MLGLISLARNDIREYGYLYTAADPGVVPGVPTTVGSKDDHRFQWAFVKTARLGTFLRPRKLHPP